MKALKIKLKDVEKIRDLLTKHGAEFVGVQTEKDIYFNQMPGRVLKIRETEKSNTLFKETLKSNIFEIETENIEDIQETKEKLTMLYGIKCIIDKKRYFYIYKSYNVNIIFIKELGNFLLIEGSDPEKLMKELGFSKEDIIPKSFSELLNK